MGRKHLKKNGQHILANKQWRDLKQAQQEWIFNQLHIHYQSWREKTGQIKLSREEENQILESLLTAMAERGIEISPKEVRSRCRMRLRRYEKRSLANH